VNRFADSHLFIVDGYGFSHLKALYGPKHQGVIYTHRFSSVREVREALKIVHGQGSKALFLVRERKQIELIKRAVRSLRKLQPPFETYPWILIAE
jgi:hypothetical protein